MYDVSRRFPDYFPARTGVHIQELISRQTFMIEITSVAGFHDSYFYLKSTLINLIIYHDE